MRVAILTPTNKPGGLDVNHASLSKQGVDDLLWVIGDDLYDRRAAQVRHYSALETVHFKPRPKPEGFYSDLAGIYNQMIERALEWDADVMVSMQDYFWLPDDALRRFIADIEQTEHKHLITGAASLMNDPPPELVDDPQGGWTVFEELYDGSMPTDFFWRDCRIDNHPQDQGLIQVPPVEWELNWAAWPAWMCEQGLRFDEEFGRHIAYENQDFAWQAYLMYDALCYMDTESHARGLPHKQYWPHHEEEGLPHALANKELCEAKWGDVHRMITPTI